MPSSRAAMSTVHSTKYAASGRPAPRYGPVGALDVVDAAHQHRRRVRGNSRGRHQVAAEVGPDPRAYGQHRAVVVERELDLGLHPAALVGGHEVLLAVLGPLDRA